MNRALEPEEHVRLGLAAGRGIRAHCGLVVGLGEHEHAASCCEPLRFFDESATDPLPTEPLVHLELVEEDVRVSVYARQLVRIREARELAVDFGDPDVEIVERERVRRFVVARHAGLVAAAQLL